MIENPGRNRSLLFGIFGRVLKHWKDSEIKTSVGELSPEAHGDGADGADGDGCVLKRKFENDMSIIRKGCMKLHGWLCESFILFSFLWFYHDGSVKLQGFFFISSATTSCGCVVFP